MIALMLAALIAHPSPSPSPAATAAYYDRLQLPAEVGDRHAELRSAIGEILGERLVVTESDEPGAPEYTRETACAKLGVRHLVTVSGAALVAISGPRPGFTSFDLAAWIWDCRDHREAANVRVMSAWYKDADTKALRTMYAALSASFVERLRKGFTERSTIP